MSLEGACYNRDNMGKALYRKYRPTSLSDVIGQDQVVRPLSSALKSGNISHAYLFTGPRGCGKTSVARIFAHEVNRFSYEIEDTYTDIIEIDAASNTGVDNIRDLIEKTVIAPSEGKYKVYIIDEVHMLSKSAFNALLKTLEEPPRHVIFIMATTDAYKVPITITSRSQVYNFQLATPTVMLKHLQKITKEEKIAISDDALGLIVARGGGSFRDSISLLDQISTLSSGGEITDQTVRDALGMPEEQMIDELLQTYREKDFAKITEILQNLLNDGKKPELLAENIIERIVANPEGALLPLLAKLPEVKDSFPEAKIMLAFLSDISDGRPVVAPKQLVAPKQSITSEKPTPQVAQESKASNEDFSWEEFIENAKKDSPSLGVILKKCAHSYQNGEVIINPARKIEQSILESKNNRAILKKYLPENTSIIISTDVQKPEKNAEKFGVVSDIMGNIEEVKSDGIPFK